MAKATGACDYAAFAALNLPGGFQTDLANDATLSENEVANVTCSGTNEYLDPAPADGSNQLGIPCAAGDTFTAPGSWPTCVVKCAVPTPADGSGFSPQPGNDTIAVLKVNVLSCCFCKSHQMARWPLVRRGRSRAMTLMPR